MLKSCPRRITQTASEKIHRHNPIIFTKKIRQRRQRPMIAAAPKD